MASELLDSPFNGLLPCPFCGSSRVYMCRERDADDMGDFMFVACSRCRAQSARTFAATYKEVRDAWNIRSAPKNDYWNQEQEHGLSK